MYMKGKGCRRGGKGVCERGKGCMREGKGVAEGERVRYEREDENAGLVRPQGSSARKERQGATLDRREGERTCARGVRVGVRPASARAPIPFVADGAIRRARSRRAVVARFGCPRRQELVTTRRISWHKPEGRGAECGLASPAHWWRRRPHLDKAHPLHPLLCKNSPLGTTLLPRSSEMTRESFGGARTWKCPDRRAARDEL